MQVAVIGPADATPDECATARAIGRGLAEAGHVVVTGGRGGVMAAATAGAADEGGVTLALLPGDTRAEEDAPATIVLPTGLGEARNALVVRAADAVVAIGGAWGTLSELALAARRGTPIIGLGTWALADAATRTGEPAPIVTVDTPDEAVAAVARLTGAGR